MPARDKLGTIGWGGRMAEIATPETVTFVPAGVTSGRSSFVLVVFPRFFSVSNAPFPDPVFFGFASHLILKKHPPKNAYYIKIKTQQIKKQKRNSSLRKET